MIQNNIPMKQGLVYTTYNLQFTIYTLLFSYKLHITSHNLLEHLSIIHCQHKSYWNTYQLFTVNINLTGTPINYSLFQLKFTVWISFHALFSLSLVFSIFNIRIPCISSSLILWNTYRVSGLFIQLASICFSIITVTPIKYASPYQFN